MSLFGEALPFEDDTATSLIRREGFPPNGSYDQMPQMYVCPCCSAISPTQERERLMRTAKEEKELERRRLLQLDVFDERAKPLSSSSNRPRNATQNHNHLGDEEQDNRPSVPPPPPTIDDLRKARANANNTKLIVTVHHGKGINVDPRDPVSVLVRCGAFEGQTAKVPRGKGPACTWEELFEFPYPNEEEPLEVLVLDDALPADRDHLFGGIVIPPHALRNRQRGDEESLPVCSEEEMHRSYGRMKETPMGAIVVSWYVKRANDEVEEDKARQNLEGPVDCVFVVHRVFQYTDNGSMPYSGGVLCVLRDMDDNCSESVLHLPGSEGNTSTSPYYTKEGFDYLPENPAQLMQLITGKKLGHVLVCVPKNEDGNGEGEEELLVVGAVPLDFEKLYHKGTAVLLVESKAREDVLWGEISLEWQLIQHAEVQKALEDPRGSQTDALKDRADEEGKGPTESLFVTIVRGLNLRNRDGEPITTAQVSVFVGDMEGSTFASANELEDENANVVHWNQEVRFIEVEGGHSSIELEVVEDKQPISNGRFELNDDEAAIVVKMHDPYDEENELGEIVVSYNRVRSSDPDEPKNGYDSHYNEGKDKHEIPEDGNKNENERELTKNSEEKTSTHKDYDDEEEPQPDKNAPMSERQQERTQKDNEEGIYPNEEDEDQYRELDDEPHETKGEDTQGSGQHKGDSDDYRELDEPEDDHVGQQQREGNEKKNEEGIYPNEEDEDQYREMGDEPHETKGEDTQGSGQHKGDSDDYRELDEPEDDHVGQQQREGNEKKNEEERPEEDEDQYRELDDEPHGNEKVKKNEAAREKAKKDGAAARGKPKKDDETATRGKPKKDDDAAAREKAKKDDAAAREKAKKDDAAAREKAKKDDAAAREKAKKDDAAAREKAKKDETEAREKAKKDETEAREKAKKDDAAAREKAKKDETEAREKAKKDEAAAREKAKKGDEAAADEKARRGDEQMEEDAQMYPVEDDDGVKQREAAEIPAPSRPWQTSPGMPPTPDRSKVAPRPKDEGINEARRPQQIAAPKMPEVKGPWYPSGSANNEEHVPLAKRESFRQRADSIRELERRSRGSTKSSARHSSQNAQSGNEVTPR